VSSTVRGRKRRRKRMRLSFEDLWEEEYVAMAYSCCDYEYWYLDEALEESNDSCGTAC
jgi:hypothetical protein